MNEHFFNKNTCCTNNFSLIPNNKNVGFHFITDNVSYKLECPIRREGIRIKICVEVNKIDFAELKKLDLFHNKDISTFKSDETNSKLILEDNISFFIPDEELISKLKGYLAGLKITILPIEPLLS